MPRLGEMVSEFLIHVQAKGGEKGTLEFYRNKLPQVIRELGNPELEDLGRRDVQNWLLAQQERLNKPHYTASNGREYMLKRGGLQSNWRVLRAFLNYLAQEKLIAPVTEGFYVKPNKPLIESLSNTEISGLLESARQRATPHRERALLTLWLDTGLRPREMAELGTDDLDFRGNVVTVRRGKNGASRVVPFGANSYKALNRYLTFERNHMDGPRSKDRLWLTRWGLPLVQDGIAETLHDLGEAAGSSRNIYPYLLRHTFARLFLVNGGDAFTLCRLMGHNTMHMTLTYVHFFKDELIRLHGRVSPVDNL